MTGKDWLTIFIPVTYAKESVMNTRPQRLSFSLPNQSVLALPDAHEVDIECRSGALWITLDNDRRDIVLNPGQHFRADSHRRALVEAIEPSCVRLSGQRLALAPAAPAPKQQLSPWRLRPQAHGMSPA
jgi:hypothetical protein